MSCTVEVTCLFSAFLKIFSYLHFCGKNYCTLFRRSTRSTGTDHGYIESNLKLASAFLFLVSGIEGGYYSFPTQVNGRGAKIQRD